MYVYYIDRHSVLIYCVAIFEFVSEQELFALKTCELNNVQSGCVPFPHVHRLPFVSPCTCQDVEDAALEMWSCFLAGVRVETEHSSSLCCPLLLCFLACVLVEQAVALRVEPGQNGLSALETDRVESSMHPDDLL